MRRRARPCAPGPAVPIAHDMRTLPGTVRTSHRLRQLQRSAPRPGMPGGHQIHLDGAAMHVVTSRRRLSVQKALLRSAGPRGRAAENGLLQSLPSTRGEGCAWLAVFRHGDATHVHSAHHSSPWSKAHASVFSFESSEVLGWVVPRPRRGPTPFSLRRPRIRGGTMRNDAPRICLESPLASRIAAASLAPIPWLLVLRGRKRRPSCRCGSKLGRDRSRTSEH